MGVTHPKEVPDMDLHHDIPLSLRAPTEARHPLDHLGSALSSKVLEDIRLIVTELVANSVQHSRLQEGDPSH
jgi:anti-sigma regulatory factor (Ser/Thr protein kinase)